MDYYAVLDLKPECTNEEIKAQYRRLARECHPDVNPDDRAGATERLREINAAYEVLSKPAKRRRYDARRPGGASTAATPPPPTRRQVHDNVAPMSAEEIYRAQRRQNGRNFVLAVIVLITFSSIWHRVTSPSPPAQTWTDTAPVTQADPAPSETAPTDLSTPQPTSSATELKADFDRIQPQIDLVLTRGIDIRNEQSRGPSDTTDPAAVDRLVTDLNRLRSVDDAAQTDVAALQQPGDGQSTDAIVDRASDELQQAVLAGRDVVHDIRELNGTARP